MKTVFVRPGGEVAIPSTVYPGPTSPGAIIEYGESRFVVNDQEQFTRRVARNPALGDEWERVVGVDLVVADKAPAANKGKGKDRQNAGGKTLMKEST